MHHFKKQALSDTILHAVASRLDFFENEGVATEPTIKQALSGTILYAVVRHLTFFDGSQNPNIDDQFSGLGSHRKRR